MLRRPIVTLGSLVLALALSALPAGAQTEKGAIVGTVTDSTGAVLPGATVTITNLRTGGAQTYITNARGAYDAPFLDPGLYRVEVTLSGFQSFSVPVVVNVGSRSRADAQLGVPGVAEEVMVRATPAIVQTDSASIGQIIDETRLTTLPTGDRNIYQFMTLTSTVTAPPGGNAPAFRLESGGSFSISGTRPSSITFKIDGLANTDPTFGTPTITPSLDAVQEFQLQNSAYSAEFEGIGQVNVATKAGGSRYQGSLFDYFRNEALQPTNPVLNRKPRQRFNQFGGTLGGPVVGLNQTFFFFSYEGRRQDAFSVGAVRVLTAAERAGDFSLHLGGCQMVGAATVPLLGPDGSPSGDCVRVGQIFDPLTTVANPAFNAGAGVSALNPQFIRQPFANNQIPSGRISGVARALIDEQQPLPNAANPNLNYSGVAGPKIDLNQYSVRVDRVLSKNHRLYGRLALQNNERINRPLLPHQAKNLTGKGRVFNSTWTAILGPAIVNEFRVGYVRGIYGDSLDETDPRQFGVQNTFLNTLPRIFLQPGNLNYGGFSASILQTTQDTFQLASTLSWIRGRHSLKVGAALDHNRFHNGELGNNTGGTATFNGLYSAGNNGIAGTQTHAMADFLLGFAQSSSLASPAVARVRNTPWSVFVQDDWRIRERLTLNAGLRYEYHQPWAEQNLGGAAMDLSGAGRLLVVDGQVAAAANSPYVVCCAPRRAVRADRNDLAPRVGIAWQPFAEDGLTVRTGYGLFYSGMTQFFAWRQYEPFLRPAFQGAAGDFLNPGAQLDNLFPAERFSQTGGIVPFLPAGVNPAIFQRPVISLSTLGSNSTPYSHQWSVSLQRELLPRMLAEVAYTGSAGRNLPIQWIFNQPTASPVPVNFASLDPAANPYLRRPYECCSITTFVVANVLESAYHAVTARVDRRFSDGYQFLTSYTWSKSTDQGSEVFAVGNAFNILPNNQDFESNRGRSSFDVPHRWVSSGTMELPFGVDRRWLNRPGVAGTLAGGWALSGIFTIQSGFPYTPDIRNLRSNTGYALATERGDLLGDPYWSSDQWKRLVEEWKAGNDLLFLIDRSAIDLNYALGTFGNIPRNFFRTPYGYQLDLALSKRTPLPAGAQLQFRLDALNVTSERLHRLNLVAFVRAQNFLTNPTVGGIPPYRNMFNPRILQLSARVTF
ncbi:MAG: TonB-dependent receptor [Acidobacteria bacterium]|nr:TonB-dependent receptor [Acidobacteriota bacterium]MBA3884213.1 TonB-dependent receptor [Acidobacteriota bacterium]